MANERQQFMTIRQAARAGPLSEYALRSMAHRGVLPCIYSGRKCLINYDLLLEQLGRLSIRKEGE